jgi:hypothetical protein
MKPICVPCQRFFRMVKSGFYFIEAMPKPNPPGEGDPPPGTAAPDRWQPYKVWSGDKWQCPGCGAEIVAGVGRGPISEHFMPDFHGIVARVNATQFTVNDC